MTCHYPECPGGQGGTVCRADCALRTDLRTAAQQALGAMEAALSDDQPYIERCKQTITALRAALAGHECPNCASLEEQNTELDRKLTELTQAVMRANGITE